MAQAGLKVEPVSLEDLRFALEVAYRSSEGNIPVDPTKKSVTFVDDEGDPEETITFTDNPFNRAMFGVYDAFKDKDRDYKQALFQRLLALSEATAWPMCQQYVHPSAELGANQIEDVVVQAAASCDLSAQSLKFDKFKFRRALKSAA